MGIYCLCTFLMQKKSWRKILSNPTYIGLILIGILLLSVVISLIFKGNKGTDAPITEGQIQIVKGDEVITVNQNGLVEYRSKDKVYSEYWDASQINSFFLLMEQKARNYLTRKVSGGDCGYKVFMFVDGKLVTVCLDSSDSDMAEVIEPIFIKYSDITVTDLFGNDDGTPTPGGDDFNGEINFPTTTPGVTQIPPTPTPNPVNNQNTNYAPVESSCDAWSADIVKNRAIISNTYCTIDLTPSPTP